MLTNFEREFVDFCCNDIEAKSSFLLFATAEKSAAKRLFAFSTFYNHYIEDRLDEMVERFLSAEGDEPMLLYIWGHSYEMDAEYISWEHFEEILSRLSGHDDIFYGTNAEVLLK